MVCFLLLLKVNLFSAGNIERCIFFHITTINNFDGFFDESWEATCPILPKKVYFHWVT